MRKLAVAWTYKGSGFSNVRNPKSRKDSLNAVFEMWAKELYLQNFIWKKPLPFQNENILRNLK